MTNQNNSKELPVNFFENNRFNEDQDFLDSLEDRRDLKLDLEDFSNQGFENPTGNPPPTDDPSKQQANPLEEFKFDETLAEEERKELAELNAKLGTNFKELKELKESIKRNDNKEENQAIEQDRSLMVYFEEVLKYDDEKLVFEDKRIAAQQAGKNIKDRDVLEEIEMEVEKLKDNGVLAYAASSIRSSVKNAYENKKSVVEGYDNKNKLSQQETEKKFKEDIQESIGQLFKEGSFLGMKLSREDLLNVYKDVSKNKHIDHLRANPADAVQFALFLKYRAEIAKKLGKPDFKAGVKSALEEIGLANSNPPGNGIASAENGSDDELSYIQKLLK